MKLNSLPHRFSSIIRIGLFATIFTTSFMKSQALNIVITNDDGFETKNIQALFTALVGAGHDVIMSTPYSDQSGTSGQVAFLTPITPTTKASAHGLLPAGSPGVGPTTIAANQYYVDGSPVAAVLYGIDVAAINKWGKAPDLVISGPNVGNNVGLLNVHSGTVAAAIAALNRRIPAIAVSAASDDATAAPLVGAVTVRLVASLTSNGAINLPKGVGLNVNLPTLDATKSAASYSFAITHIGTAASAGLQFFAKIGSSPIAVAYGIPSATPYPGVSMAIPYTAAGYPADGDPLSEYNMLAKGVVTVSPMQISYQASNDSCLAVAQQLSSVISAAPALSNPKILDISSRAVVGTGDSVQIVGFVVSGTRQKTVLIRAAGPSLASLGLSNVLSDTWLDVYQGTTLVASNDNWSDDSTKVAAIETAAARAGAWAWTRGSKDSALLLTLTPGTYTIVVRGVAGATGVALVETFDAASD